MINILHIGLPRLIQPCKARPFQLVKIHELFGWTSIFHLLEKEKPQIIAHYFPDKELQGSLGIILSQYINDLRRHTDPRKFVSGRKWSFSLGANDVAIHISRENTQCELVEAEVPYNGILDLGPYKEPNIAIF